MKPQSIQVQDVANRVAPLIHKVRINPDITLKVLADQIRLEDETWYVPVKPTREPARLFEYYEALAEIEVQLLDEDDLSVVLVPAAVE